jgi:hypothetical protein
VQMGIRDSPCREFESVRNWGSGFGPWDEVVGYRWNLEDARLDLSKWVTDSGLVGAL